MPPAEEVLEVAGALERALGLPPKASAGDPVSGLILAILSQNTNDRNRDRAFQRLRERFPAWEEVAEAQPEEVEETIRVAGLSKLKSRRIVGCLRGLMGPDGKVTMDRLRGMSVEQGQRELLAIPGVGIKTARCVLLFEFGLPAFPVDTHILRVCKRLGWLPPKASAQKAHEILQELVPPELVHSLHVHLIHLGRTRCRPRSPGCGNCPILRWCQTGKEVAQPSSVELHEGKSFK